MDTKDQNKQDPGSLGCLEIDKLQEYVTGACSTILGVEKDSFYKKIHSQENQEMIRTFSNDSQLRHLIVTRKQNKEGEEQVDIQLEMVKDQLLGQSVIFIKRVKDNLDLKEGAEQNKESMPVSDQLQVYNLSYKDSEGPFEVGQNYVQHCLIPAFNIYKEVIEANESNNVDTYNQLLKKLREVNLGLIQFQQSVYVPQIQLMFDPVIKAKIQEASQLGLKAKVDDFDLDDSDFINNLVKTVTKWTSDIQQVIKQNFDLSNGNTLQEINFWMKYERALSIIDLQLKQPEVELTLNILRVKRKVQVTAYFNDLNFKNVLQRAKECNKFIKELPINDILSANSLDQIHQSVVNLFSHLQNLNNLDSYSGKRSVELIEAIQRDLTEQILKILNQEDCMNIKFFDYEMIIKKKFYDMLNKWNNDMINFKEMMRSCKGTSKLITDYLNNIKNRIDFIFRVRRPHEKLKEIIQSTQQKNGKNEQSTFLDIQEMDEAYQIFSKMDVFDISSAGTAAFVHASTIYNEKIGRIETHITMKLRELLSNSTNANEMLKILQKFNSLSSRERFRAVIHEYQSQLLENVGRYIQMLKDKYVKTFGDTDTAKISQSRDIPPISAQIIWIIQIQRRLQMYRERVATTIGPNWNDMNEAKQLNETIEKFEKHLSPIPLCNQWTTDMAQKIREMNLTKKLFEIIQRKEIEIKLNFDDWITTLFKEVRHFKNFRSQRIKLSYSVTNTAKEVKQIYPYAMSLRESLHSFKQICSKVDGKVAKLVAQQRLDVLVAIQTGFGFTWHSKHLSIYTKKLAEKVLALEDGVILLKEKIEKVQTQLTSLLTCEPTRDNFLDKIVQIQAVIDDFNFKDYANLHLWVPELDNKIEEMLSKRLEEMIDQWFSEFEDFQQKQYEGTNVQVGKPTHHELQIQNQQIFLDPPLDFAKFYWFQNLHRLIGTVCTLPRLDSNRYKRAQALSANKQVYSQGIISKLPKGYIQGIYEKLNNVFQRAEKYVDTWLSYQALWSIENRKVFDKLDDDIELWQQLLNELKQDRQTFDNNETEKYFGAILIDYRLVQAKINNKYDAWHKEIIHTFAETFGEQIKSFYSNIQQSRQKLEKMNFQTATGNDIVNIITDLQEIKKKYSGWATMVDKFKAGQKLLDRQRFVPPSDWLYTDMVEGEWNVFRQIFQRKCGQMEQEFPNLQQRILQEEQQVNEKVGEIENLWRNQKPYSGELTPNEALQILELVENRLEKVSDNYNKICKAKELLGLEGGDPEKLNILQEDCTGLKQVWSELDKVWSKIDVLKETPINAIVPKKLQQSLNQAGELMDELPSKFSTYQCYDQMKVKIQNIKKTNLLVMEMKNECMKDRHWRKVLQKLKINNVVFNELTLGQVWAADPQKHKAAIETILTDARGEQVLEDMIQKVKNNWQKFELEMVRYQSKCKLIRGWDDMFSLLDEDLGNLHSMKMSPYYKSFEEEVKPWDEKLQKIRIVMDIWMDVQRKWVYLESIFNGASDIRTQLANEYTRFKGVDSEFTQLMKKVANNPAIIQVISIPEIQKTLERLSDLFEKIKKALGDYLEVQRSGFARFYFVGDDDLLEIIGNSKDVKAVQRHFTKMYAGITALESEDNDLITGIVSREGEIVKYVQPVKVSDDSTIRVWLRKVDDQMQISLSVVLENTLKKMSAVEDSKSLDIIKDNPGQTSLLALQVLWASRMEEALMSQDLNTNLQKVIDREVAFLSLLAEKVLDPLERAFRQKLEQAITEKVHERDVSRQLVIDKVTSVKDFGWQFYLKFYFNPKETVQAKKLKATCDKANFYYGFEYLGIGDRLVQTALTDRCFLTLTHALHLRMGGAPFGPAGTGKTESVKALGGQLGYFVLVFNCDETFDFNAMGRIFVGLCQVGAWGCFDEFNRLEERMLSAVSQQILTIQVGLKEGMQQIDLLNRDVKLNPQMGIFVTMNPGYAGRSNLPENLKQLFRQMAMIKPDRELIAQVSLFSLGYKTAERLSGKIVSLFELCADQLSNQPHYDFGLRALKSVLVSSGNMKREAQKEIAEKGETIPDLEKFEQGILIRSVCETFVPKLIQDDIPLLSNLLLGVFPNSEIPVITEEKLRAAIKKVCVRRNLMPEFSFMEKCLQLYTIQRLSHGVMLVGPSGCGKSACWKVLAEAIEIVDKIQTVWYIIDPKAIIKDELYGKLDPTTLEWTDGVFTGVLRKITENQRGESTKKHWIVFDGDVDPEWAENLNSVLDDNKLLTLPNGERISIPSNVRLLFEVETLKYATLATVSRCGMVWFSEEVISLNMIFNNYLLRLKQDDYDGLKPLNEEESQEMKTKDQETRAKCVEAITPMFIGDKAFVANAVMESANCGTKHVMEYTFIRIIEAMFALIRKSISNVLEYNEAHNEFEMEQEVLNKYMRKQSVLAIMWGFSGSLKLFERANYSKKIEILIENSNIEGLSLPKDLIQYCLIDYECRIDDGEWNLWKNKVPTVDIDPQKVTDADLIISTVDTLRHQDILCSWLSEHRPFILCGPPGSGKTMTLMSTLKALPDFEMIFVNFSSSTSPNLIQQQFEHYGEYMKTSSGTILRPKQPNKWLVLFCDEINLPDSDKYGTQPVITFLRQLTEQNGFWRPSDKTFITLERIQFVGACNPPTDIGRSVLSNRFLRHCPLMLVDFPGRHSLTQIYGTFNRAMLKRNNSIRNLADQLTEAMVEFYMKSQEHFTADMQPHYIYSPRELTRWKYAINEALDPLETQEDLVRLWAHEALRLFQDRLVYDEEKEWCDNLVDDVASTCFPQLKPGCLDRPILFTSYITKHYESVERERLREFIQARLSVFNEEVLNVQLVIFDSVLEHILRIDRVLRQPLGHLLLVGSSGVGKTTLSRFVSWMNHLSVFQIKAGRNYSLADFDTDLRDVMKRAGVKNEKITFIFDESNVLSVAFLERMNALLASGEVPGLFEGDDYNVLINLMKDSAINHKQVVDTEDQLYKTFIKNVQRNLHVVFTMNPCNPDFSNRTASSPALFNRCVIDWFGDWSQEALIQVAKEFTKNIDPGAESFTKPQISNDVDARAGAVVATIVGVHNSVCNLNLRLQKAAKKFNFLTPRDFLDFIKHFIELHTQKIDQLQDQQMHLSSGLNKLNETAQQVILMQGSLDSYKKELDIKDKEANQKLNMIVDQKGKANVSQEESIKLKGELEIKRAHANEKQQVVELELEAALPALEAAQKSVSSISREKLTIIKNLPNPPMPVKTTINAVLCMILLKGQEYDWKVMRTEIAKSDFIKKVTEFKTENLPNQAKDFIMKTFVESDSEKGKAHIAAVHRSSQEVGALAEWVYSSLMFSKLLLKVDPLRQEINELQAQQEVMENKNNELQEYLIKLEQDIETYEKDYKVLVSNQAKIKNEMQSVQDKVTRSQNLLLNLQSEKDRWQNSQQQFQQQIAATPGDSLLASAFLAYLGFFDHFYRQVLLQHWNSILEKESISYREDMSIIQYLSKPSDRFIWQSHKLPSDDLCTENAIILSKFHKYPLIIDPSGQALEYILSFYKNKKISRTSFADDSFMKNLETALRFGCPLLVQDVEKIDPILNSVLNKELHKTGGRVLIRVGDQEIDFVDSFLMFMITRDSSAKFTPDLCSRVTFVNFTVTPASLQNQCLNIYLKHERADIEEQRTDLLKLQGEYQVKLRELEDSLLSALNNGQANILEDTKVIATLETLKKEAGEVQVRMDKSEVVMEEVTLVRNQYIPLAQAASKVYFSLQSLSSLHYLYQFSLAFFMDTVWQVLDKNEQLKTVPKTESKQRQDIIHRELFIRIYRRANNTFLAQDKMIFALRLVQIFLGPEFKEHLDTFIKPSTILETKLSTRLLQGKLSMPQLKLLEDISSKKERFLGLLNNIEMNEAKWIKFLTAATAEDEIPTGWENQQYEEELKDKLKEEQKQQVAQHLKDLSILRILRPDRLQRKVNQLINLVLGEGFMNDDQMEMNEIVDNESSTRSPILLCSAPGFDPSFKVESLSKERSVRLMGVAIGSQESLEQAEKYVDQACKSGNWVLLKNVHLAPSWLTELEKKIHRITNANSNFRLFLTMEFNPKVPATLIRQTFKIVFEPPEGIKASLQRSYKQVITANKSERAPAERAKLHFIIAWLHAVILERLRFTPLGWTKRYEFNEADQRCALETIDEAINALGERQNIPHDKLPWDGIRSILRISLYGGKIDNEFDTKVLEALINYFCNQKVFDSNYPLFVCNDSTEALKVPSATKYSQYVQWIEQLPDKQTPQWAGLPLAVEKVLRETQGVRVITKLFELQDSADEEITLEEDKDKKKENSGSQVQWLRQLGERTLAFTQILPKEVPYMERSHEKMKDPLFRFLEREVNIAGQLLSAIRKQLKDLHSMCIGNINATNLLKQLALDLHAEQVPKQWHKFQFQQQISANEWLIDFKKRIDQFQNLNQTKKYHQQGVWLGGLLFPEAFLTATRQYVSQVNSWSLEELELKIDLHDGSMVDENSFLVTGMYIEGATWSSSTKQLGISNEISQQLPSVKFTWMKVTKEERALKADQILVPVYLNRFRQNLLFSVKMNSHGLSSNILYQRGIALISWNI